MILGVGVDITQNSRFKSWPERDQSQLRHIFSEQELGLIKDLGNQQKIEFYASRFVAKEAFYKAFSSALVKLKIHEQTTQTFDFLFSCKHINVSHGAFNIPQIDINWQAFAQRLEVKIPKLQADLSISHEKDYSVAVVVISL